MVACEAASVPFLACSIAELQHSEQRAGGVGRAFELECWLQSAAPLPVVLPPHSTCPHLGRFAKSSRERCAMSETCVQEGLCVHAAAAARRELRGEAERRRG